MLFVDNDGNTDARFNLALEEHVLRTVSSDEDLLLFYVNRPSIIIGSNQNTIEEIDPDVVADKGIQVVRRVSGGGAVYHDLGNLNFSFMTRDVHGNFNRYDRFNGPVLDVLHDLGVPAQLSGRNDIVVDGRKISGNAQYATPRRMLSHGTLLVDSNLDDVTAALRPRPGKVESKGMKSIRSRVANINEFLSEPIAVDELRTRILARIFETSDPARLPMVQLGDDDREATRLLVEQKYAAWEWNYGRNPSGNVQRSERFPAGEVDVRIDLHAGCIADIRIFGDFMGRAPVAEIERRLRGVRYDGAALRTALEDLDLRDYFGNIEPDDVLAVLAG